MSTYRFWEDASKKDYDLLVLGEDAPAEIRVFLQEEDKKLSEVVDRYIQNNEDVIFVEIGSGTGRYLRCFGRKIITDKGYANHLKYVVGLDFCKPMIQTSIKNLVCSREVNGKTFTSLADRLASDTGLKLDSIRDKLSSRIQLINGDATNPFLEVSGAHVVVGIMFGTLGNISRSDQVFRNVNRIFTDGGKVIITVFNRKFLDIGRQSYKELAEGGFQSLESLSLEDFSFRSREGFYSHWFDETDFKSSLAKHFHGEPEIVSFATRGLMSIAEPKPPATRSRRKKLQLNILCPKCGKTIGILPVQPKRLTCSSCGIAYDVEEFKGFRYPVLMAKRQGVA